MLDLGREIKMRTTYINFPGNDYKSFKYPDGAIQVRITNLETILNASTINIVGKITSAEQIIELALLKSAISNSVSENVKINLILPMLPYSRADRSFVEGDCLGLETFCNLMKSLNWNKIYSLDIHNSSKVKDFIVDLNPSRFIFNAFNSFSKNKYKIILFPDEGAKNRYQNNIPDGVKVCYCTKQRDPVTGKLNGFDVPTISPIHDILVVDDICDGGGTFKGIANQLYNRIPGRYNISLYVTHFLGSASGIVSPDVCLKDLCKNNINKVYTTDSVHSCIQSENIEIMKINWDLFIDYDSERI